MKRRVVLVLAVLPLVTAPVYRQEGRLNHGRVFAADTAEISVRPGEVFSLHWNLAVDPGMDHRPVDPAPDPAVLRFAGADEIRGDPDYMGDGGELYLVFKAGARGTTEVTVDNCFGCREAARRGFGERRTYRVTVGRP